MKKILVSMSAVAMLAAMAAPALADNVNCSATLCADRGGSISNKNINVTNTTVTNVNEAEVQNEVTTVSNSGNNLVTAGGDVNGGAVTSGASTANTTVSTKANVIVSSVDTTGTDSEGTTPAVTSSQADRGGSTAVVNVQKNNATVGNGNTALVGNAVAGGSNTGGNGVFSFHDVNNGMVTSGVSGGTTSVGVVTNAISSMVVR